MGVTVGVRSVFIPNILTLTEEQREIAPSPVVGGRQKLPVNYPLSLGTWT